MFDYKVKASAFGSASAAAAVFYPVGCSAPDEHTERAVSFGGGDDDLSVVFPGGDSWDGFVGALMEASKGGYAPGLYECSVGGCQWSLEIDRENWRAKFVGDLDKRFYVIGAKRGVTPEILDGESLGFDVPMDFFTVLCGAVHGMDPAKNDLVAGIWGASDWISGASGEQCLPVIENPRHLGEHLYWLRSLFVTSKERGRLAFLPESDQRPAVTASFA